MPSALSHDSSPALDLYQAIRGGDSAALDVLLNKHEGLASARIERHGGTITPLHLATDWPGYYPNGPEVVRILVAQGADPNAATEGSSGNPETPLHWAASSDDVDVAEALIDSGADVRVPGGSIGTPLDNAVGYGCWHVARLLVARGAPVEHLWQAAALGLTSRMRSSVLRRLRIAASPGEHGQPPERDARRRTAGRSSIPRRLGGSAAAAAPYGPAGQETEPIVQPVRQLLHGDQATSAAASSIASGRPSRPRADRILDHGRGAERPIHRSDGARRGR